MAAVTKALLFSSPFVGAGVGAVASQSGGSSQGSSSKSILSPVKEAVSPSSESPTSSPETKVCSIVRIKWPNGNGQKITKEETFTLETLKSQQNVVEDSPFYKDVTDACNKTNPNAKPAVEDTVYVTYSGSSWNYSMSYQKDWESKNWVRE
ncbi:hypothetical protein MHF_0630 [Mycoplasma haemofelis Ohio2]|uniref:Uncharacterized protein n=1 Tax=Mycoplasma haemofelis (strain Ohio2) TaxID=859194 RepID=F6FI54_MYCHI|nr:hypothetical protein MHF_0630 [Mycoplasma haemofelis Ohio2]